MASVQVLQHVTDRGTPQGVAPTDTILIAGLANLAAGAATLFDENICRFERGTVAVELADQDQLGMTRWSNTGARHEVAVDVDTARFFREFFGAFGIFG